MILSLAIGLSVGLTRQGNNIDASKEPVSQNTAINANLEVYDDALRLLESTPLQSKQLPSGESLTYREYHIEQPHTLVVLPGFMADDTMTSLLAVLPEFRDHRKYSMK